MTDPTALRLAPPRVETLPDQWVQGLDISLEDGAGAIPGLWVRAMERIGREVRDRPDLAYGLCHGRAPMRYLAGMVLPERIAGLDRVLLPAGRYAIWEHRGPVGEIHRTFAAIRDHGLEEAGLTAREAPEFERYGQDFDAASGEGPVEIGIAVA